jgi:hypothetical protein
MPLSITEPTPFDLRQPKTADELSMNPMNPMNRILIRREESWLCKKNSKLALVSPVLCGISTKALQGSLAMLNHAPPAKPRILRQGKKEVALMWYHSNHLIQTLLESQDKYPPTRKSGPPHLQPKCARTICWVSGESCCKSCAGSNPASPSSDFAAWTTLFAVWPCRVSASKA